LIDQGLLDPNARVDGYLEAFKGSDIGKATVQQVLDMLSGLPTLLDFHTPGAPGQLFEVEQGLQPGTPMDGICSCPDHQLSHFHIDLASQQTETTI
jgi:CubicO group peptidase (beta-lactamase class C family)